MEKVTIEKISKQTTNKAGQPYIGKNGKPYTRVGLKTKEHGETWLSGFGNSVTDGWNEGDVVEVIVEVKGDFTNFSVPKKEDAIAERLAKLEAQVSCIVDQLKEKTTEDTVNYPEDESEDLSESKDLPDIDPEEIPF